MWTIFANDPNQTNDTNVFQAISKYHPAKPNDDSVLIAYATAATITPTSGVTQWQVYNSTSAPRPKSEIYWYRDTNDAAPFFVGNTLVTDTVRMDTTFYFRQKRNKAIVRITQLEFAHANNTVGLTPAMPYWMSNSRKIALQLTNVGDAPLVIHQAIASCGCTVPTYTKSPIAPGETGTIDVTYNGKGKFPGHFKKTITIRSNAKENGVTRLTIEGNMEANK